MPSDAVHVDMRMYMYMYKYVYLYSCIGIFVHASVARHRSSLVARQSSVLVRRSSVVGRWFGWTHREGPSDLPEVLPVRVDEQDHGQADGGRLGVAGGI